jgi:hypothetical protein
MDTEKTEIDGFTFELNQLPAWDSAEASMRLMKIVGAGAIPISKLFDSSKATADKLDMKLVAVLIEILREAPVAEVMSLSKMLLTGCIVGGDLDNGVGKVRLAPLAPIFNNLFRGKQMTVFKLIAWAIKVNFTGFFVDLKSALPALPAAPNPKASPSSSMSPTPSADAGPVAG